MLSIHRASPSDVAAMHNVCPHRGRQLISVPDGVHSVRGKGRKVAEAGTDYGLLDPAQLAARLKQLEARMHKHAQDLEFEQAAKVRDEIHRLRTQGLMA